MKKWMTVFLSLLMALLLCPCAAEGADLEAQIASIDMEIAQTEAMIAALEAQLADLKAQQTQLSIKLLTSGGAIIVEIDVADYGVIVAQLYPEKAPITVANFVKLAKEGFYDGLTFHRIISGFMIQGGDPNGNGTGGSAQKIKGEFSANGVANDLAHERGVLSMARSNAPDSASSQFFIMHEAAPHLDGSYAAFGKVLSGMEVVDAICAQTPVQDWNGTVAKANQPVITSIRVLEGAAE